MSSDFAYCVKCCSLVLIVAMLVVGGIVCFDRLIGLEKAELDYKVAKVKAEAPAPVETKVIIPQKQPVINVTVNSRGDCIRINDTIRCYQ